MYRFIAYGLGFHSDLKLFDLPGWEIKSDVTIHVADINPEGEVDENLKPYIKLTSQEAIYSMDGIGRFHVIDGREIIVDPDQGANLNLVKRYLMGVATALLLYQRGRVVLHGSAVNINGKGIVFLGGTGAGKSSIGAVFLSKGYDLLVDDVTSIQVDAGSVWLHAGFPYLKLSDDALNSIKPVPKQLQFVDRLEDKQGFLILSNSPMDRIPLEKIYIILPGEKIQFSQYNFQQALIELIRYSIPASMVKMDYSAHFTRCLGLVNCVPVFKLERPVSLSGLSELVDQVIVHTAE